MEWSHDFCLSCDRQISEGAYCSQACRLADLEKAGTSDQTSNLSSSASSSTSSASSNPGFYLPPAVNFAAFKTPSTSRGFDLGPSSHHYYPTNHSTHYSHHASNAPAVSSPTLNRSLSPSSSRSSLASAASQSTSGISQQAANQLNSYVRSFDQVRDMKRRLNTY